MRKKKRKKIVYIKWFDSAYASKGEFHPDDIPDDGSVVIETCGLFVKETKKGIHLALDWTEAGGWRHLVFIPKVNIIEKIIEEI